MADRVYICKAEIKEADILDWTSSYAEKIILPCKVTDPLLCTVHEIITDATPFTGNQKSPEDLERFTAEVDRIFDTATATATIMLLLYPWNIWAGCKLVINLADGNEIKKQLPNTLRPWQIRPIADEYFRRGGAGLTEEDRNRWKGYYAEWKRRNPQHSTTAVERAEDTSRIDAILTQTEGQEYYPDN